MIRTALPVAVGLAALSCLSAHADEAVHLASHRAVYEMTLARTTGKSSLREASGRLVYQIVGSDCDGYATQSRFVSRMINDSGEERTVDLRTSTFEDPAGTRMDFVNESFEGGKSVQIAKGVARRQEDGLSVKLELPKATAFPLAASFNFPARHLETLITAARAGRRLASIDLYDGTADGETRYHTGIVIGAQRPTGDRDDVDRGRDLDKLALTPAWPVTISFFKDGGPRSEETADYSFSAILHDNGVSRRISFDYGDYVLTGRMIEFEFIDPPACQR